MLVVIRFRVRFLALLFNLGYHDIVGMIEVEQKIDRLLAVPHRHRFAANQSRKGGQALLTVEEKLAALKSGGLLRDRELT